MKSIRRLLTIFGAALVTGTALATASIAAELTDIGSHWAKQYIEYGVEKGYIKGYEDSTFKPDGPVTRAEFSKMINSSVGITMTKNADFDDVSTRDWFFEDVKKASYAGYITGYEDGTFRPNNKISRQEAAVILHRISVPSDKRAKLDNFSDSEEIASWAADAVSAIAAKGYITGDENKNFNPTINLTRAQAAKLIYEFVENENIHNGDFNIANGSPRFSETLFTDSVILSQRLKNADVVLDGCRVLGAIVIDGTDTTVSAANSAFGTVTAQSEDAVISFTEGSKATTVNVLSPATLMGDGFTNVAIAGEDLIMGTVVLEGSFGNVSVGSDAIIKNDGSIEALTVNGKIDLVLQGGNIEQLEVASASAGAEIKLSQNTTVKQANVNAAVNFTGKGTIENAFNAVNGVTYETQPENVTGRQPETEADKAGKLRAPTITPVNGQRNVNAATNILIGYSIPLYNKNGDAVNTNYINNNVKVRYRTATGTVVNCTVTYDTAYNGSSTITLNPRTDLIANERYYITIPANTFFDEDGNSNAAISYYFDVAQEVAAVTFAPESGDTDVKINSNIRITFSTAIKTSSGSAVTNAYLLNAIMLTKTSTGGDEIGFSATISGSRTVTITPDEVLEPNTRYYVTVLANYFTDASGNKLARSYAYFTTENNLIPTVTPANNSTNVSTMPEITIEFNEAVTRANGNAVNPLYVESTVALRKVSPTGLEIPFTATVSTDKKTITITPGEYLEKSTRYYVVIDEGIFKGQTGKALNERVTSLFTTAASMAPVVTPASGKKGVSTGTSITVDFGEALYTTAYAATRQSITADYIDTNEVVVLRRNNATNGVKVACDVTVSADCSTITLAPKNELLADYTYYVVVKQRMLYNSQGRYNSAASTSFSTTDALAPEFAPYSGETEVLTTTRPQITFDEAIYNTVTGKVLSNTTADIAYLRNSVIKLYEGTKTNGTLLAYTLTFNGRIATLTPTANSGKLKGDTQYTIVIEEGSIQNSDKSTNPEFSATFMTESSIDKTITYTPERNERNVSVYTDVKIELASKIYTYGIGELNAEYVAQNIYITGRVGNVANQKIDTDLTISADGKTITLTPLGSVSLLPNTVYTVVFTRNAFQYEDGTVVPFANYTFTTGTGIPVVSTFRNVSAGASTAVFEVLSDTDGDLKVTATPTNGSPIVQHFNVSAGVAKNITLTGLAPQTSYTVKAQLTAASNQVSAEKVISGTIRTIKAFNATTANVGEASVDVLVEAYTAGTFSVTYKNVATGQTKIRTTDEALPSGGRSTVKINGLDPETQYIVTVEFVCDGDAADAVTTELDVTTTQAVNVLSVEAITVEIEGGKAYTPKLDDININVYTDPTTFVKVKVDATGNNAIAQINGVTTAIGAYTANIAVTAGTPLNIPVIVTNGEDVLNYTLVINANQ